MSKVLRFSLEVPMFSGLNRAKYAEKYTKIPLKAYPAEALALMQSLYDILKIVLTDESNSLTVIASEAGYAQRLVGPRVYKDGDSLNPEEEPGSKARDSKNLYIKVGQEKVYIDQDMTEDGLPVYKVNGKTCSIVPIGDNPALQVPLGSGRLAQIPFFTLRKEDDSNATFDDFVQRTAYGDYSLIGTASAGGSKDPMYFSALKYLPVGRYLVAKTAVKEGGTYGPKVKITLLMEAEAKISTSQKVEDLWMQVETDVPVGAKVVVDANTGLTKALMGTMLEPENKVYLDVVSKEERDGKMFVDAAFDFSESPLRFSYA